MTSLQKHKSQWVLIIDKNGVLVKKYRTKKEALLYCQTNELDVIELDKNGVCSKTHLFNSESLRVNAVFADALKNVK